MSFLATGLYGGKSCSAQGRFPIEAPSISAIIDIYSTYRPNAVSL